MSPLPWYPGRAHGIRRRWRYPAKPAQGRMSWCCHARRRQTRIAKLCVDRVDAGLPSPARRGPSVLSSLRNLSLSSPRSLDPGRRARAQALAVRRDQKDKVLYVRFLAYSHTVTRERMFRPSVQAARASKPAALSPAMPPTALSPEPAGSLPAPQCMRRQVCDAEASEGTGKRILCFRQRRGHDLADQ